MLFKAFTVDFLYVCTNCTNQWYMAHKAIINKKTAWIEIITLQNLEVYAWWKMFYWNSSIFLIFLEYENPCIFLSNKYPGQCQHREVRKEKGGKYMCKCIFWLCHFIKHIPLIFKEWIFILSLSISFCHLRLLLFS